MLEHAQTLAGSSSMFNFKTFFLMAVINSLAIGNGVKSAGNITYRRTRGRTIASQRITENKSNTAAQQAQRGKFKVMTQFASLIAAYIGLAYDKTKYGSQRNNFIKLNKETLPDVNATQLLNVQKGTSPLGTFLLDALNINGAHDASCISIYSYGSAGAWIVSPSGSQVTKSNAYSIVEVSNGQKLDATKLQIAWTTIKDNAVTTGITSFDETGQPADNDGFTSVLDISLEGIAAGMFDKVKLSVSVEASSTTCAAMFAVIYDGKIVTSRYCIGQKSA